MKGVEGSRWRLAEDAEFLTQEWDGMLVLFHGGSGDTHLLDSSATRIYKILHQGPADTEELLLAVETTAAASAGGGASPHSQLMRTLGVLQRLDIVEPLPL